MCPTKYIDLARPPAPADPTKSRAETYAVHASAFGAGFLWLGSKGFLVRIDPATSQVQATERNATVIGFGFGSVWATGTGMVERIDPQSQSTQATVVTGASALRCCNTFAFGFGSVWLSVASASGGLVLRIDPALNAVSTRIPIEGDPQAVAVGEHAVFVANNWIDSKVVNVIDPSTNNLAAPIATPSKTLQVAVTGSILWATTISNDDTQEWSDLYRIPLST